MDDLSSGKRENVPAAATLHELDVREPLERLFDEVRPQSVFHLAAQADVRVSIERPDFDAGVNVIGTVRVLEGARRSGASVVFASTGGAIYGECARPAREDDPRLPLAPYGTSKLAGEEYLATYNRLYGTGHVALRLGNVFGPRQDPHGEAGVVAIFLRRLARGETRRIFGDGAQPRDYVSVGDARGPGAAARNGGVFNIGTATETSVVDLYAVCLDVAGSRSLPSTRRRARRAAAELLDARLCARADWRPRRRSPTAVRCGVDSEGVALRRVNHRGAGSSVSASMPSSACGRTLVASALAAVELVIPMVVGVTLLAKPVAAEVRQAAEAKVFAPIKAAPMQPRLQAAKVGAPKLTRAQTSVLVLNGGGRTGAAAAQAASLEARGYTIGAVGNAPRTDYTRSLVMYRTGFAAEAARLAKDSRIKIVGPLDGLRARDLDGAHVVLVMP